MWHRIEFGAGFSGTRCSENAEGMTAIKWLQRRCSETRELCLQVRPSHKTWAALVAADTAHAQHRNIIAHHHAATRSGCRGRNDATVPRAMHLLSTPCAAAVQIMQAGSAATQDAAAIDVLLAVSPGHKLQRLVLGSLACVYDSVSSNVLVRMSSVCRLGRPFQSQVTHSNSYLAALESHQNHRVSYRSSCIALQAHVHLLGGLTSLDCNLRSPVDSLHLETLFAGLLALRACALHVGASSRAVQQEVPALFPSTLLRCTALTSLRMSCSSHSYLLDWGGLPEGITALQRLAQLRLESTLTQPLTDAVSALGTWHILTTHTVPPSNIFDLMMCTAVDAYHAW